MARQGIYARDETTLSWGSIATGTTNAAPSTDTEIDCRNAKSIIIQVDCVSTTFPGDDTDINVMTRTEDATTYDTVPFAEANFGSAVARSFAITPGFAYMKLRADNNHGTTACAPKAIVQVLG